MKQLTIEEKARRYDEAIEIAKNINNEQRAQPFNVMIRVFPELKESENERIRKEMIETLKNEAHEFPSSIIAEKSKSWIAWLEKQEEHSLSDVAKEVTKNKETAISFLKSCGIMDENGELAEEYRIKQGEQKSAWLSKEDEDYYDAIIVKLEITKDDAMLTDNQMDFLKSLKDRVQPQPKQEWSEEDEKHLNRAINILDASKTYTTSPEKYEETINWLKFLKERYTWKPSNEQMNALSVAVKHGKTDDPDALKKLLKQLKKYYL